MSGVVTFRILCRILKALSVLVTYLGVLHILAVISFHLNFLRFFVIVRALLAELPTWNDQQLGTQLVTGLALFGIGFAFYLIADELRFRSIEKHKPHRE